MRQQVTELALMLKHIRQKFSAPATARPDRELDGTLADQRRPASAVELAT
jgi:hypothetical protein